ncbi:hypothetical protein KIW84_050060 [Lathyrus oleraceus]|uniref:MCM10 OB-fold domain-containing protein n=1 Tax=Pisum sativum TaxID=3888 RepID=A0A9D4WKM8_PEA|nr:hypothetical protein KIW84_050060 [Pisum sativum]
MSSNEDDLDLLLSLQDKVPETPPASPSPLDFDGDDDVVPQRERPDMSVFKDAVQDCLLDQPPNPNPKPKPYNKSLGDDPQLDKFSGLRIRNQCLTPAELRESVQDIRFVRLPVIKNLVNGDNFSGNWVTVGVLTGKGIQKTSSNGKSFCIWKIGCLDENTVPIFLFGNAYQRNCQEQAGTVFAFFNCGVRKDAKSFIGGSLDPQFGHKLDSPTMDSYFHGRFRQVIGDAYYAYHSQDEFGFTVRD